MRTAVAAVVSIVSCTFAGVAAAQPAPPPGFAPAPQAYPPPPPGAYYVPPPPAPAPQGPKTMDYDEERAVPPGYHKEERKRKGLLIAGSVIFGTFYFGSIVAAGSTKDKAYSPLYVPLVGPFITAGTTHAKFTTADGGGFGYLALGLLQCGGAAMALGGFFSHKTVLARDDVALAVVPVVTPGGAGVGVAGAL